MLKKTSVFALAMLFVFTSFTGCLGGDDDDDTTTSTSYSEDLIIAYEVKDDYENPDENPQIMADYLTNELKMNVKLYPITSEGSIIEALRFGNAHIAFMDGAAAWVGWKQYGLDAMAADQKSDGRTHYDAHAVVLKDSEMAAAYLDDDAATDPFSLLAGKTSCHTGWLKSAGMLLPMGFLIGNGYANVIGDPNDIESLRATVLNFFSDDSSIPDSGTPYYSYSGAVKCLSEGAGHVAFAKDSTVDGYCANDNATDNEAWCLPRDDYVLLPSYGSAPSHPVMYNPEFVNAETKTKIQNALVAMNETDAGLAILDKILGTPGITKVTAEEHLGSYGSLIEDIPGINAYYKDKYTINETVTPTVSKIRIAYEVKDDYENPDENPQAMADFIAAQTGVEVTLYPVTSEGSIIEALRFGNADIAFMDGGAAWVAWKQYGLATMAADTKSDGRTYYNAHAWVHKDSEMATALNDDDASTDPFALLEGKTSCHTGWLKSAGMLLPMGYLISNDYADIVGDADDIESLRDTILNFFNENASIPDSGTPYHGYAGAVKCLSEGFGDVAFAKDSTVDSYCGNDNASLNEDWCLAREDYVPLPAFGQAPSHPVMYNPDKLDVQTRTAILNALLAMNNEMYVVDYEMQGQKYTGCYNKITHQINSTSDRNICGGEIMSNILGTSGLVEANTQEHLGSYSSLISALPGISTYYDTKYEISES